jgi:hypothetical protein
VTNSDYAGCYLIVASCSATVCSYHTQICIHEGRGGPHWRRTSIGFRLLFCVMWLIGSTGRSVVRWCEIAISPSRYTTGGALCNKAQGNSRAQGAGETGHHAL